MAQEHYPGCDRQHTPRQLRSVARAEAEAAAIAANAPGEFTPTDADTSAYRPSPPRVYPPISQETANRAVLLELLPALMCVVTVGLIVGLIALAIAVHRSSPLHSYGAGHTRFVAAMLRRRCRMDDGRATQSRLRHVDRPVRPCVVPALGHSNLRARRRRIHLSRRRGQHPQPRRHLGNPVPFGMMFLIAVRASFSGRVCIRPAPTPQRAHRRG